MRFEEAEALKPGALLSVRQEVLDDDSDDPSDTQSLRDVVTDNGYIYRFAKLLPNDHYPIQCHSLVTGKHMEFHLGEVDAVKEQDDGIL